MNVVTPEQLPKAVIDYQKLANALQAYKNTTLANVAGVKKQAISGYFAGKSGMSAQVLMRVCLFANLDPREFVVVKNSGPQSQLSLD